MCKTDLLPLAVVVSLLFGCNKIEASDQVPDLVQTLFAHRDSISSGSLKIHSKVSFFKAGDLRRHNDVEYSVWFDGVRRRVDASIAYSGDFMKGERYFEGWSYNGIDYAFYSNEEHADGGRTASYFTSEEDGRRLHVFYDPRLIGLCAGSYLQCASSGMRSILGSPLFVSNNSGAEQEIEGDLCVLIKCKHEDGDAVVDFWLAKNRNCEPKRIEARFGNVAERSDIQIVDVPGFGAFPSQIRYSRSESGVEVKNEELLVEVVQFNKSIEKSVFDFSAWNPPAGMEMVDKRPGKVGYVEWTGDGVRRLEEPRPAERPIHRPKVKWNPSIFTILIFNGIIFSLIALFVVIRQIRR